MATEYQRTLEWLYTLEAAKGMDFKLERVALALERLGNPQRRFASVHVAGTNGKGSVAAMLHAMLSAGGHRVGLYVSPHLERFTERIRVGQAEVTEAEVVELASDVRRVAASRGAELTFFELVTVMAFLHFARAGVEVAVVEVGLGGRLDATNVIDPEVSVITTIALDHTEFLGETIAAVAAEKGGIIKPHRPVVIGVVGAEAAAVLNRIAAERHAEVFQAGRDYRVTSTEEGLQFDGLGSSFRGLELGVPGTYQYENAATALAAVAVLRSRFPLAEAAIRGGLASVRWPGRFETVGTTPLIILDGAHNVAGMAALVSELTPLLRGRKLHVLFAVMRDKQWRAMIELLGPLCASATVTQVLPPRGEAPEQVADIFRSYCPAGCEADPVQAWEKTRTRVGSDDVLLVTGSLFLVGAIAPLVRASAIARREPAGTVYP